MFREIAVFIISALPVGELRAGILMGLSWKLNPWLVFTLATIGNFLPVIPLLYLLEPVSNFLRQKSAWLDEKLTNLFTKTRHKHSERVHRYGALGLALFVAIPSPGTGAWTGCLLAFLFDLEKKYAIPAIFAGVLGAGLLVTAFGLGIVSILRYLNNPVVTLVVLALVIWLFWRFREANN